MNRKVGQASRLPSAEGAFPLGRFAAGAGETPALRWGRVPALALAAAMLLQPAFAADKSDKKEPKKPEPPRVVVTMPLAVAVGQTTSVRVRGENLTNVTELRFTNAAVKAAATIRSRTTLDLPKGVETNKVGNTQMEVEIDVPADAAPGTNYFTVISPIGQSAPQPLVMLSADELIGEREPNGGFKQAQPLAPGKTLVGAVREAADVDVFRFEGRAGQRAVIEVCAARHGAPLDPLLTLYDAAGHILAVSDDADGSPDSRLKFRLPTDGSYFVSVIDAFDRGGPAYVYLLRVRLEQ
ncbi:MAG TPA: PPC domain-containing protein [Verrucomicrobiae bacterium]|nr:PPC domain-containing protein [Verrucomicrobiae bacterium]